MKKILALLSFVFVACGSEENPTESLPIPAATDFQYMANVAPFDYGTFPWLQGVKRDVKMTQNESKIFYEFFKDYLEEKENLTKAYQDAYNDVPWARSAPCAVTASAFLENAFKEAGLPKQSKMFSDHTKFGPTHNVEIMLYRMGWEYWLLKDYKVQKGVGLLAGRFLWRGFPKHSGHVFFTYEDESVMTSNSGFKSPYRGRGWEAGTEGIWLPPGIKPVSRYAQPEPTPTPTPDCQCRCCCRCCEEDAG